MKRALTFLSLLFLFATVKSEAQSMGFGCLGLFGGFAGYSYQSYKPVGVNNYINEFNTSNQDSLQGPLQKLGKAKGFRVGINFFRADIRGLILTAKGYYQELKDKTEASVNSPMGITHTTMDLKLKTFGVGFDVGTTLTKSLGWKIIDAVLVYNSSNFVITSDYPNAYTSVSSFNSENSSIGYTVGTGFILNLIDQYISIEGTAAYSFISIHKMKNNDTYLMESETSAVPMNNFIEAGGLNMVIQLNIGFPLL